MIYFENDQFHFFPLRANFRAHGELTSKYTNDRQYWQDFVSKWWHHDSLSFESVQPTPEQQARLDELNQQPDLDELHDAEAVAFVESGVVLPDTEAPFLTPLIDQQATVTLEHYQGQKRDAARTKRWEAEQAGTSVAGMSIRTDEQSQARVTSLVTAVQADPEADNFDFEAQPNQWVTVNRDTAITIGKAVSAHVQACFTRCRELHELINAATTISDLETIDINEGW